MKLIHIKHIIHYALPICATNLFSMGAAFFVTMMLAELGETTLAALAIANACYITLSVFLNTCMYSTSILIGQHTSSNNKKAISGIIWNSFWLAMILGILGTALLWQGDKFLLLIGQPKALVDSTTQYFHYAALTLIPILFGSVISQAYNGLGKPVVSTIFVIIRLPLTLYFSYELILGHYHLGLAGASYGLLLAQIVALLLGIIYMRFTSIWDYFSIKGVKYWDWQEIKQVFNLGIHVGLQFLGEISAISVATFFMGYLGSVALASSQVVSQYSVLLVMIILGVSQAVSIRVSEACSRKEYALIDAYNAAALMIICITIALYSVLYLLIPNVLMSAFMDVHDPKNQSLMELTQWLMWIMIPVMVFSGIKDVYTGSLRGLKNSKTPMVIGTLSLWLVGLPLSYLMGIFYQGGAIGLRIGFSIGFLVSAVVVWIYFLKFKKQFQGLSEC